MTIPHQWNETYRSYPQDRCIHQIVEDQTSRTPNAIAVVFEDQTLTYSQLNNKANQMAHYLREHGVDSGVPVGLCLDRSLEMLVAVVAILKAGGAYLPLDPQYPNKRLLFMVKSVGAQLIVTDTDLQSNFPESIEKFNLTQLAAINHFPSDNPRCTCRADDLAYIMFTSGSTGTPKGVAIPHRAIVRLVFGQDFMPFGADLKMLQLAPISFDASTLEIWGPLLHGGRCVLYPDRLPEFIKLEEVLRCHQINALWLTASLFNTIIDARPSILETVATILTGGEALSVAHIRKALETLPNVQLVNGYGPTENTTFTCCYRIPRNIAESIQSIPIGKPIGNTQVHILDSNLQPVPCGMSGELYISGEGLALGYVNQPELTAEKFIHNPFSNNPDRLYKTGDICCWMEDGNIEYRGRTDDQIKIRGLRIELGEIESVLQTHPTLKQAVVIAREDEPGQKVLVGYVILNEQGTLEAKTLQQHLAEKLPDYMVPSVFVEIKNLPLTISGKTDRKALPKPEKAARIQKQSTAPKTVVQQKIADIWQNILGIPSVCLEDNFFELGGHSLKAIQTIYQVQNCFGTHIPVSCLFKNPTLKDFSETVDSLSAQVSSQLSTIKHVSRDQQLPLSFSQRQLWFIEQLALNIPVYNISFLIILEGELDTPALEASIRTIINRHESFRTTFQLVENKIAQVLIPINHWKLDIDNISIPSETTLDKEFCRIAKQRAKQIFNIEKGPLFDFHLLKADSTHHALVLNMHHLITDGWSLGVVAKELTELYNSQINGLEQNLKELPIQNADFAAWQKQHLQKLLNHSLKYWQKTLDGKIPEITLPCDHPRPATQTYNGEWIDYSISSKLYSSLQELSRNQHVTLNMTMLTAFKILLHRILGVDDIIVGSPISGRTHPQIENLIGFFVNTVVLRTNLKDNPTILDALERVRQTSLNAQEHQDLPYEIVVERLNPNRDPSRNPFFQTMFAYQDARVWQPEFSNLRAQGIEIGTDTAKIDFTLFAEENDNGLLFRAEYNTDLYNSQTINRFLRLYEHILKSIVSNPQQRLNEISLVTEKELKAITQWNATSRPYPQSRCIHHFFEEQATKIPDALAVVFENHNLTYSQLNTKANQLAHYLRDKGVRSDVPVGVCMDRSLEMIVALYGILKAGGAYVPVDPVYPRARIEHIIHESGISILLTDNNNASRIDGLGLVRLNLDTADSNLSDQKVSNPDWTVPINSLAYIIYTSGSTGKPKGVMNEHKGILNRLLWAQETFPLGEHDRVLQKTPYSFDVSVPEFFWSLMFGAQLVVAQPGRHKDPDYLVQTIIKHKITSVEFVPSMLDVLLKHPQVQNCCSIRQVYCAGEALSYDIQKRFFQIFSADLYNLYGPTEAAVEVSWWKCDPDSSLTFVPIGKPIANTQLYILDSMMNQVPPGVDGELYIGGVQVARGYVNRTESTKESFLPDPFNTEQSSRLYKTGDICRWLDDGNIEYLGRTDDQIKLRGFRIELGEIENVLRQHASVLQAVVMIREDLPNQKYLAGYVILEGDSTTEEDLLNYLTQKLPAYMVPSVIMKVELIPLTNNGKADRKSLPKPEIRTQETKQHTPLTKTEIKLAELWKHLLNIDSIGLNDHFFRLGGHSLLAAELFFKIREHFTINLPLHTIFQAPTIRQLAKVIDSTTWDLTTKDLVLIKPGKGTQPIFYLPGIGGHTLSFYHLAETMQLNHPQYGLNLPGMDGNTEPLKTIEELATYFIELIQTVQPHGPYNLCGYSFGGRVAFEMAIQLQDAGETIDFLGLLGATAPGYLPTSEIRWRRTMYRIFDFLSVGPAKQWDYLRFKIRNKLLRKHKQNGKPNFPNQQNVVDASMKAWYRYVPSRQLKGDLTVIRENFTFSELYSRYSDPQYGWAKYVHGTIHSNSIDCAHLDLFKPPHVAVLGGILEEYVRSSLV